MRVVGDLEGTTRAFSQTHWVHVCLRVLENPQTGRFGYDPGGLRPSLILANTPTEHTSLEWSDFLDFFRKWVDFAREVKRYDRGRIRSPVVLNTDRGDGPVPDPYAWLTRQ